MRILEQKTIEKLLVEIVEEFSGKFHPTLSSIIYSSKISEYGVLNAILSIKSHAAGFDDMYA